jgi:hypothetical protein
LLTQTTGPAKIEKQVWIWDVEDLLLFIPIDSTLIWEFLLRQLGHVQTRAGDAGSHWRFSFADIHRPFKEFLVREGQPWWVTGHRLQYNAIYVPLCSVAEFVGLSLGPSRPGSSVQNVDQRPKVAVSSPWIK